MYTVMNRYVSEHYYAGRCCFRQQVALLLRVRFWRYSTSTSVYTSSVDVHVIKNMSTKMASCNLILFSAVRIAVSVL